MLPEQQGRFPKAAWPEGTSWCHHLGVPYRPGSIQVLVAESPWEQQLFSHIYTPQYKTKLPCNVNKKKQNAEKTVSLQTHFCCPNYTSVVLGLTRK